MATAMRRRRFVLVAAACLVGAALGVSSGSAVTVRPGGPLALAAGSYFGALVNPNRSTPSSTPAEVAALESEIGRKLDIVNHFYLYNKPVGTQGEVQDISGGRIPMVTWGATDTHAITDGSQDAYITAQALRLKNLNAPVFLRYYHEPDGDYRQPIVHSAADYIAAWRHARDLFRTAGATNVVWVFCTTTYTFRTVPATPPSAYYPGDAYVDWVAGDGYNFAPVKPGARWNSFTTVFGKWYDWAATKPKPIMVAEYGVLDDPAIARRKADWYNTMASAVKTSMPLVQAVVAWSTANTKSGLVYNWNVDSTPDALNAWTAMGHDPYFNQVRR